jgi:hypothetical protein
VVVLAIAALAAHSVALAGFGLDSLIEILASIVVVWQLTDRYRRVWASGGSPASPECVERRGSVR